MEEIKEITVKVKTMDSHFIELQVRPDTAVLDIKQKILQVRFADPENPHRDREAADRLQGPETQRPRSRQPARTGGRLRAAPDRLARAGPVPARAAAGAACAEPAAA